MGLLGCGNSMYGELEKATRVKPTSEPPSKIRSKSVDLTAGGFFGLAQILEAEDPLTVNGFSLNYGSANGVDQPEVLGEAPPFAAEAPA